MMEKIKELVKHIVAKAVTVAATVVIANNGVAVVYEFAFGKTPSGEALAALLLVTSYAVWTQAVVPFVEEFFKTTVTPSKKAVPAGIGINGHADYFKVV